MTPPESSAYLSPRRPWLAALAEPASIISALKWGALVGAVFYIVGLLLNYLTELALSGGGAPTQNPVVLLPLCGSIFVYVFALYVAGFLPAAERNHVAPGLVGVAVMLIVSKILSQIYTPPVTSTTGSAAPSSSNLVLQIVSLVLSLALYLFIGWIGAFYAVKRNTKAQAVKEGIDGPR